MPITPYALNVKGVDFGQSLNALNAVRQMQAASQQREMNALAMQKAQNEMADAQALKNALGQYDINTPEGQNALMRTPGGLPLVSAFQKNAAAQQKAKSEGLKTDLELFSKAAGFMPDTAENYKYLYEGATKDNPALSGVLPHWNQYKPGMMQQIGVGLTEMYKRATQEEANAAKIRAAEIGAREKPFSAGGGVVYVPGQGFVTAPTPAKEPTDWKAELGEGGTLQYFSPSTGQTKVSTGFPVKGTAGAKTAAQQAQDEKKLEASQNIGDIIDRASSAFDVLDQENAITSSEKGPLSNIAAAAKASPTGQAIGGVLGTKAQQARNELEVLQPLFIAQLKNATGLSAQQLNSNAELKLFLQALGGKDLVTARKNLSLVKQMFAERGLPTNAKEITQTFATVNRLSKKPETKQAGTNIPQSALDAKITPELWQEMNDEERSHFKD